MQINLSYYSSNARITEPLGKAVGEARVTKTQIIVESATIMFGQAHMPASKKNPYRFTKRNGLKIPYLSGGGWRVDQDSLKQINQET